MSNKTKKKSKIIIENNNFNKPIITHLPIYINKKSINKEDIEKDNTIKDLKEQIKVLNNKLEDNYNQELFNIDNDNNNNKNINCWWCRHCFKNPKVTLPENLFKSKFNTFGVFCSYNCALSYNIDINDENLYKRTSLLYYLYKKTYNKNVEIVKAPSWKILKNYGGIVSIDTFRKSFIFNEYEYNYIKPPIISCIYQIEKILKKPKKNTTEKYILKRKKPLNNSKYNLENTMGLKKTINATD